MAFSITIPFFSVKLQFKTGGTIVTPLMDTQLLALNEGTSELASRFEELFQEKILNKGEFLKLMNFVNEQDFYKASLSMPFDKAKDGFSYPAFELAFEYFFKKTENGFWGIVPSIGVEAFSVHDIEDSLINAIQVDFIRKRRLSSVQHIISSIWFQHSELLQKEINFQLPDLSEQENDNDEHGEKLLEKVSKVLIVENQVSYGRKSEIEQLARA